MQNKIHQFQACGAAVVALCPQRQPFSEAIVERLNLSFPVIQDPNNLVATAFKLTLPTPEAVTVLNPGMAILALTLVSIPDVRETYQTNLLSHMGQVASGHWLSTLIEQLSDQWQIPTNLMFIGSPSGKLGFRLSELSGVRLII